MSITQIFFVRDERILKQRKSKQNLQRVISVNITSLFNEFDNHVRTLLIPSGNLI